MSDRLIWTLGTVVAYVAIHFFSRMAGLSPWMYGLLYGLLGMVLLGAVSRWWRNGSAALWRPTMLGLGSLAAAGEISSRANLWSGSLEQQWMIALIGLLAAAILVRLVPPSMNRRWLGIDRRVHDRGA